MLDMISVFLNLASLICDPATHSSTLAWKIPWTEEPGRLQSMGSRRVGHLLSNFTFTFHFHALEKEMAIHSSVLAWRIPGKGEPGGLPSMWSHRVEHNWNNLAAAAILDHYVVIFLVPCNSLYFWSLFYLSIATPAFFWFPFAWNIFFHPLTFSLCVSLDLKWVSCRRHIYGSCFCIHSTSLCLLFGAFNLFTF